MRQSRLFTAILCLSLVPFAKQGFAQTPLPYATGFDSDAQKTGWQEFKKGVGTGSYHWNFTTTAAYSNPGCLAHSYPVGGTDTTRDWFVSPAFTLTGGGKIDSLRYVFTGFGVPGPGDTVALYLLKGSPDPALATSQTLLYDFRNANYVNDNTWRKLSDITIPATSGSCYIALYYRTVANWLDARFDNLRVRSTGTTGTGNKQLQPETVVLYPNPAGDILYFRTSASFVQTSLYDLSGKMVHRERFSTALPVAKLAAGTYIAQCVTASGELWQRSFVKR